MKSSSILFVIVLALIFLIIILTFLYQIFLFNSFNKRFQPLTDNEKNNAIDIIRNNLNINESVVRFGKVLHLKDKDILQIEIINNGKKQFYIIDLKNQRMIRK